MKSNTFVEDEIDDFRACSKNLMNFKKDMKTLTTGINIIKNEMVTQKIPHQIQEVTLSRQWEEFSEVQSKIEKLKEKLKFETEVYENLKQICVSLTLDEENLHILKNGSFENDEDLLRMEKSLKIMTDFSESRYSINIIKETKSEISEVVSLFLKRFVIYLSKAFVLPESRSELKVHSSFYNSIKKYKFIYKASKTNSNYYNILCKAYMKKSTDLYNKEFHTHLNRLSELINDNKSLEIAIETIIKSYICLFESENDFMKFMEIDSDPNEVFNDVNKMIINFIDLFYRNSSYCILASLAQFLDEEYLTKLGLLGTELKNKNNMLNEVFIHQRKSLSLSFEMVDLINFLKRNKLNIGFYEELIRITFEKAISTEYNKELNESLINLQILFSLEDDDNLPKIIDVMKKRTSRKVIDFVFSFEHLKVGISNVFGCLKKGRNGFVKIKTFLKEVILENCDDSNRNEAVTILSKF